MKRIVYLMFLLLICSCHNSKSKQEYLKMLDYFGPELTNYFPSSDCVYNNENETGVDTSGDYGNTESFYVKFENNTAGLFDAISKKHKSHVLLNNDDSLLVVSDFVNIENLSDDFYNKKSQVLSIDLKKVVPNFWWISDVDNRTKTKLGKDYKFYVLESKLGNFSKKIDPSISSMPDSIMHGFSEGVAINAKTKDVIFWLVIW